MPQSVCVQGASDSAASELFARLKFISIVSALLFLGGWLFWLSPYDDLLDRSGTPLGGDYPMFYIAGRMILDGDTSRLYDQAEHQRRLHELFPALSPTVCLPFRYPPIVAILMAPLAKFSYPTSLALFVAISGLASVATWRLLVNRLRAEAPNVRAIVTYGWFCWPVAIEVIIGGQASFLATLIAASVFELVRRERWWLAGLILSLAAYKPNVLSLFAIGLLVRYPRLFLPTLSGGGALLAMMSITLGFEPIEAYVELASQLAVNTWELETPYWKQHGMGGWLAMLFLGHERRLVVGIGVALVAMTVALWRANVHRTGEDRGAGLFAAGLLIVNSLFNPYTPIYDLALLGVAAIWIVDTFVRERKWFVELVNGGIAKPSVVTLLTIQMLVVSLYLGPHLSQALAVRTHGQLFSIWAVVVLVVGLVIVLRRELNCVIPSVLQSGKS